ncbi:FAD-binding protein [Aquabacterium lacunae]|uniref:FAD-binding protein n=1 Tax=Aquabacterium lacunae TaxID=2528630 RepID=A0A4Q9H2G2_9BURK|nr:GMC family oxidoreductase [Aquabacterium lacunae]TBO34403.1 FAD-binding protein [Aquabacterium lacunae]
MSKLPDVFRQGQAQHQWKLFNGELGLPEKITCDVAIIGSGAGAGITAELLTKAGLDVVILEEGPLRTSTDFNQTETQAYNDLYQESATRATMDNSMSILQGRCVGGTTVINWTSSFRTPDDTLKFWQDQFGLKELNKEAMAPWFEGAEKRLNVEPWEPAPNPNNELLRTGASKLGITAKVIPRNVKGCWNTGSCGMGCPTNAKQSMLITTIPTALTNGARLYHQTRAEKLEISNGEVQGVVCSGIRVNGDRVSDKQMRVVAKHYVVSGGAINSPALLKRSDTPDPHGILGTRTFLHPVTFSSGVFSDKVEGWAGAPQTIYSDHYLHTQPVDGPMGFKIEATPMHPGLTSVLLGGVGADLAERFKHYPNTQLLLSLLRDGFHPDAVGGTVMLNIDGSPLLNYPITPYVLEGAKRSLLAMSEIQFAAGAQKVLPYHAQGRYFSNMAEAKAAIDQFAMEPFKTGLGSAHVMGGCRMGGTEAQGVVRADGTHWQVKNLSVHDGSLFPTSLGANPQLSIYGLTNRLATQLARKLTGKDVSLAA